jgi:CheY-like chemotaxis protein
MKNAPPTRILVMDDDPLSREVLELLLASEGYEVDSVDSGDAALLNLVRERESPLPHVILADLQMPGVAGNELAQRLHEICGTQTMLLAMSGSEPKQGQSRGFDAFLRKPFSMAQLGAAIAGCEANPSPKAAPKAGGSTPVLNQVIYEKLAASMRGDKLRQLYALCLDDVRRRIANMRGFASKMDDDAFKREAHAIKGGCGMVGAMELQALASAMEEDGLGDTNYLVSLEEFTIACERLERILVAH